MNYIDITLCIPLVWGLYKGFSKGLIIEGASMLAFGLGIWGGIHFSTWVAEKISTTFNWKSEYLPIVSFAITFLGIIIAVYCIAKLIQRLIEGMELGVINKIGGALFGTLKFALIMSVFIFIINAIEKSYPMISFESKKESLLYEPIGKIAPLLIPALNDRKISALLPQ